MAETDTRDTTWRELEALMQDVGLTHQELAKRAGLSRIYVSQIVRGKRRGLAPSIKAIAGVLGMTGSQLEATRSGNRGAQRDTTVAS